MHSRLITLGFPVSTEQDFRHYVFQASEFGEKIPTANGSYTRWEVGNGIELWVQTNLHRRLRGMNPHFVGTGHTQLTLTRHITRPEYSVLEGAFYAWFHPLQPDGTPNLEYQYPLVIDVPDYDSWHSLELPHRTSVQIAAFAQQLQAYPDADAYLRTCSPHRQHSTMIYDPTGLFIPGKSVREPPLAQATFSGRILDTRTLINPVTGQRFYWVQVQTLLGTVDVVADPQVVQGQLITGGIVQGTYWLSGRLLETN